MSFFQNARNVSINDGRFYAINGDYNNTSVGGGIQALSQAISLGAMHDSSERDPPPRCHPGTRKKVAEDIIHWLKDPNSRTSVLWINGRAGVGKSALMQTIAELLRANDLDLGGCFFFRRKVPRCDRKEYLFSTLAYQFAMNVAGMREHINQAMEDNPALPTKSAAIQLQQLILKPFIHLPTPRPSPVIIIDGLDECDGSEAQRDILSLISQASTIPEITIRFIIASRPEYQIRDGFTEIQERYDTIQSENSWPTDLQVERLAWQASGQFIYATTVLKFIGSEFCDPTEQLDIILHPGPTQAIAFSELDRLYTQILSAYPNPGFLKSVLGVMTLFEGELMCAIPGTYLSFIADILGTGEGKVAAVLRALQSLTVVEGDATAPSLANTIQLFQRVEFSHKSFTDFLMDEARSNQYFVDLDVCQSQVLCRAFNLVIESVRSPLIPTTTFQTSTWRQLEFIFHSNGNQNASFAVALRWLRPSSRTALHRCFYELGSTLCDSCLQHWDVASPHVFPALHFACSALNVLRAHPCFPEVQETMDKLFIDTRHFLDTLYQQAMAASGPNAKSLVGHLALDFSVDIFSPGPTTRPVNNICKIWNVPHRVMQNFLRENSHLIWSNFYPPNLESYRGHKTISYSACRYLREFFTTPSRAQHLYQDFWILRLRKCQEAISQVIESIRRPGAQEPNSEEFIDEDFRLALGITEYFEQNRGISSSSTGILDLQGVENVAAHMALQNFLTYLSEVPWSEVFLATDASTMITIVIASWVCEYLGTFPGVLSDPTRGAVELVYQAILTNGILLEFRQRAILMEDFLNNDKATFLLIHEWISALQKSGRLQGLDGVRMHSLFKDIAHGLLGDTVRQDLTSFGTQSLEELLSQRLKRLLLPSAGFPMHYWGVVYASLLFKLPPKDESCVLILDVLFFLCVDLPEEVQSSTVNAGRSKSMPLLRGVDLVLEDAPPPYQRRRTAASDSNQDAEDRELMKIILDSYAELYNNSAVLRTSVVMYAFCEGFLISGDVK